MNILEEIVAFKKTEVERQKIAMRPEQLEKFGFFSEPSLSLKASLQHKNKSALLQNLREGHLQRV